MRLKIHSFTFYIGAEVMQILQKIDVFHFTLFCTAPQYIVSKTTTKNIS